MKVCAIACAAAVAAAVTSPAVFAQAAGFVESTPAGFAPLDPPTTLETITEAAANVLGTNSTNSTNETNNTNSTD